MDVSIIIVNYNTLKITKNCIDSIFKHTSNIKFEIILIDNASKDGSREFFSNDNRLILIENKTNIGFGSANNVGYKYARGKYIFLLNSDTYLLNNAIKIFYDIHETMSNNIACLGTVLLNENGENADSYGEYVTIQGLFKGLFSKIKLPSNRNELILFPFEVPVIIGADLFIRKDVIDKFGFFDERFFMYQEENDLQRRFKQKGYKSLIIEGPKIVHLEGESGIKKLNWLNMQGRYIYLNKWNSYSYYLVYRFLYTIIHLPSIFMFSIPYQQRKKYLKELLLYKAPNF